MHLKTRVALLSDVWNCREVD